MSLLPIQTHAASLSPPPGLAPPVVDKNEHGKNRRVRNRAPQWQSFPKINAELIAAADSGEVARLLSTIERHLPQMNIVNLSTALHRLARLTAGSAAEQMALRHHPALGRLLVGIRAALPRAQASTNPPQCQAWSNIMWSLATLEVVDLPLLEMASALAFQHASVFKSFELTAVLWALARLGAVDAMLRRCTEPLFRFAAGHIPAHVEEYTFRCLVMAAWAFAMDEHYDDRLFCSIAAQMVPGLYAASGQELANTAFAFRAAEGHLLTLQVRSGDSASLYHELFAELGRVVVCRVDNIDSSVLLHLLRELPCTPRSACGPAVRALFQEAARRVDDMEPEESQALSRVCAGILGCHTSVLSKEMLRGCCFSLASASSWDCIMPRVTRTTEEDDWALELGSSPVSSQHATRAEGLEWELDVPRYVHTSPHVTLGDEGQAMAYASLIFSAAQAELEGASSQGGFLVC